ncbi:E3 ubiquitin-protein ligase MARCHF3 [Gadus macrocephalus]|uniref:E3 ubiquitin-protein ligase MARCHF3 n=1 Tax=Gadus macrocephalus TaxID=80720 RepID=UPI0028CBABFA|nr:E3 ubiquitin-protein ligase MARCHF3 [Gadus macrocephalus]XP_059928211.1 E3 ubiquitin-protein ligase MARCHF3 [Gadus macrocephalus]
MTPNLADMTPEQLAAPWEQGEDESEVKVLLGEGLEAELNNDNQEVTYHQGGESTCWQPRTLNDSDEPFCRICHEGGSSGELVSPCECSGTLAMVHRACLERWLASSNSSHCELCRYQFSLERLPKPLTEWLRSPSMQHQRRTLCGDVVCFLFITPLATLSGWLCVQGALDLHHTNGYESLGLLVLTLALFTIYIFWTMVSVRYHIHLFQTWKLTDQRVRLQIPPPSGSKHSHMAVIACPFSKDTSKETMV